MAKVYGSWPFNLCQIGKETTPGTAVAATTIWRGVFASPEDARTRVVVEEDVGLMPQTDRSYDANLLVTIPMPATPLTFEQLPILLDSGIKNATPTGSGPYVYTYPFSVTSTPNTIKTRTLELGNTIITDDFKEVPYCFVSEFEMAGKQGEAWTMSATWQGQRLVDSVMTPALSLPAVKEALFGKTKLYIDATAGTIGTTEFSGILLDASVKVKTGIMVVPVGDGNLYYIAHKIGRPEVKFSMTFELEQDTGVSVVATERGHYENDVIRLFRLDTPGPSSRNFRIDFAGKYEKIGPYTKGGSDDNTSVTVEGRAIYSSTDALFFSTIVTNTLSALT